MFLQIHPDNPEERKIKQVVECLEQGGVIIYPTDTIYGLGCDITNQKAIERICRIKDIKPNKAQFSFICNNMSQLAEYAIQMDRSVFKLLNRALPGPFTFILKATNQVPKLLKHNKKTVGIRIPDNKIAAAITAALGRPILSTSTKIDDDVLEYETDPSILYELYGSQVDMVIDGGLGQNAASTVIDYTGNEPVILREGIGSISII